MSEAITEVRILNAMTIVAKLMEDDDNSPFAPIFERLERELEAIRDTKSTVGRARAFLASANQNAKQV